MANRVICPVCHRGVALVEGENVAAEHGPRFDPCPGSFHPGASLVSVQEAAEAGNTALPSSTAQASGVDRPRTNQATRQSDLSPWLSGRAQGDSSQGSSDKTSQTPPSPPVAVHAPLRIDGRNCRVDITCVREHGHDPPCSPYANKHRPPTVSEVICRLELTCTLVAGHGGPCAP